MAGVSADGRRCSSGGEAALDDGLDGHQESVTTGSFLAVQRRRRDSADANDRGRPQAPRCGAAAAASDLGVGDCQQRLGVGRAQAWPCRAVSHQPVAFNAGSVRLSGDAATCVHIAQLGLDRAVTHGCRNSLQLARGNTHLNATAIRK